MCTKRIILKKNFGIIHIELKKNIKICNNYNSKHIWINEIKSELEGLNLNVHLHEPIKKLIKIQIFISKIMENEIIF